MHARYFRWLNTEIKKGEMQVEFLSRYVVLLVLAICLCLGYIIKHSINFIPNKYIPLIMAIAGTLLNVWISGWKFTPEILLGGLASGLASTGTHEMIRNIIGKSETKEDNTQ
jgi:hypothetical protein